ncbi:Putative thiol oxidoreductase with 2 cytochrome c heme-binding site [Minicystis rosea]|nr:Putative thiol oxidoreductase with 2 cytochrome c heme-binding site [Minicystis rosea]
MIPQPDPVDVAIDGATDAELKAFFAGDALFGVPLHEADGLGPLYTRSSCGGCHATGLRGPGSVQKMAVVLDDGVTTAPDQSKLPWGNTVHPLVTAGASTPITPPDDPNVIVSIRVGPPIVGRGYMEAIDDAEILRVAKEQASRTDGIHGRINQVVYGSEPNPDPTFNAHRKGDVLIGRFGLKARIGTLDEFTADALQGDMGITSPLRPFEIANPDGLADDDKPGVDVSAESVNRRAMYMRLTAIPRRSGLTEEGRGLFAQAHCDGCHVPSMKTREDYPIRLLAGVDAPVFTDMLLHDLGDALADGVIDGSAQSRDWRTAPLIGLRFNKTFMHDGRALTIEEAILLHDGPGSEAADSIARFRALSDDGRAALLAFVRAL